jgi:hypothetical protein
MQETKKKKSNNGKTISMAMQGEVKQVEPCMKAG